MDQLALGETQFYWRTTASRGHPSNPVADFMEFTFSTDSKLGLAIQSPSSKVDGALRRVYAEPDNVGYLQEGHALAESYGSDFLRFADSVLGEEGPGTVLEIGSGAGWLLSQFKRRGWRGIACDPSPLAAAATAGLGLEHISEFYEADLDIDPLDLIIHYDVLEHIRNPVDFLLGNLGHLKSEGLVVFAVPDCSHQISSGDVSMVLHEHVNYFSSGSLRRVVEAAGLSVVRIEAGITGGVLFCAASAGLRSPAEPEVKANDFQLVHDEDGWLERAASGLARFQNVFDGAINAHQPIGLYIPLRAFPYIGRQVSELNLVLIDDDPGVSGRYFDGVPSQINGSSVLDELELSLVVAMTTSYEDKIRTRIRQSAKNGETKILSPRTIAIES